MSTLISAIITEKYVNAHTNISVLKEQFNVVAKQIAQTNHFEAMITPEQLQALQSGGWEVDYWG